MKLLVTLCIAGIAAAVNLKQHTNQFSQQTSQDIFDGLDIDNDSEIDASELKAIYINLGADDETASSLAKNLVKMADSDDNGKVNFLEFRKAMGGSN